MLRNYVIPAKELGNVVDAICDAYDKGIDLGVEQSSYQRGIVCPFAKGTVEELAFMRGITTGMTEEPIVTEYEGHDQVSEISVRRA